MNDEEEDEQQADRASLGELNELEDENELSNENIDLWLTENFEEGQYSNLIAKPDIQREFFENFAVQIGNLTGLHIGITQLGEAIHRVFPTVKNSRPGTASHGYRAPHYRFLRRVQ